MTAMITTGDQIFPLGKQNILAGNVDWDTDVHNVCLYDDSDDQVDTADDFLDDLNTGTVSDSATEASNEIGATKSTTNGQADGADVTMTAVPVDQEQDFVIIYQEEGGSQATPADDYLIVFIEAANGLGITPNGGDITVSWGAYIFAL